VSRRPSLARSVCRAASRLARARDIPRLVPRRFRPRS
jgi:hypothetical protein